MPWEKAVGNKMEEETSSSCRGASPGRGQQEGGPRVGCPTWTKRGEKGPSTVKGSPPRSLTLSPPGPLLPRPPPAHRGRSPACAWRSSSPPPPPPPEARREARRRAAAARRVPAAPAGEAVAAAPAPTPTPARSGAERRARAPPPRRAEVREAAGEPRRQPEPP